MFILPKRYQFLIDSYMGCFIFSIFISCIPILGLLDSQADLIGYAGGEVYGHAWMHWWRGEAFPSWPIGTDLALGMKEAPPIDLLAIIISSCVGGGAFGYNMWIWFSIFLAAIGGGTLSKRLGGDFFFGALLLAWSPPFLGSLFSGLSEDGGVGFVALAVAYACGENRSWWKTGLFLGLSCWSGLVLGWLGICLCLLLAISQGKEQLWFWIRALILSAILCVPVLWPHLDRIKGQGHRRGVLEYGLEPMWQINPWKQMDLLSLISIGRVDLESALIRVHPAYVGIGIWILALYQRQKKWLLFLFLFVGLALSETIRIGGEPTEIWNPIAWAWHQLPFAGRLNHHARAMLMVSVVLVAACAGASRWWKYVLIGEMVVLSPISLVLPTTKQLSKDALIQLRDVDIEGRVVHLPAFGPNISFQRPLWIQHIHQKPLVLHPNIPDVPQRNPFVRELFQKTTNTIDWPEDISALILETTMDSFFISSVQTRLGHPYTTDLQYIIWLNPNENMKIPNHLEYK